MVNRLPSWLFLSLAMILMGIALFPVVRAVLGIDETIAIQFLTVVYLLIGGLMCGLTAMLLMVRRQPTLSRYQSEEIQTALAAKLHATGYLIFTAIPLANFLACYYLWIKNRQYSQWLDYQGREAICFQITIYLYLLMALFMVLAIVGVFAVPLLLFFHFIVTTVATVQTARGLAFCYPANITIIERCPS